MGVDDGDAEVGDADAVVVADHDVVGLEVTEDTPVEGVVDSPTTALVMVLDDHLAGATAVDVDASGAFTAVLPISSFPYGDTPHTVTFYAADPGVASERFAFTSSTFFDGQILTFDDPVLPGVDVRVESWSDHVVDVPYDAAIAIGPLEHFARVDYTPEQKIAAYRAFFRRVHGLLAPGGRLSLQAIIYLTLETLDPFIQERIWPESDLPRLPEILAAADRLFELEAQWTGREDYARTCAEWARRLSARREEAEALVGAEMVSDYLRYLKMSVRAFEASALGLVRLQLRRLG